MKNKERYNEKFLKLLQGDRNKKGILYELTYTSPKSKIRKTFHKVKRLYSFRAGNDNEAKKIIDEWMNRPYHG